MRTFVATSNAGKLAEMKAIFGGSNLELETYPNYVAPAEGESSYLDNALLKARALHAQLLAAGLPVCVLSDDSGLEVAALGGRPGVLSARYAGEDVSWAHRRAALLEEMRDVAPELRSASFVCHMALVFADGHAIVATGRVRGSISLEERGEAGFGFDPIFLYRPLARTFAELSEDEKNRCSHRRHAADTLLALVRMHGR